MADKTAPQITFNLDSLERNEADRPPFVVAVDGRAITLTDPQELDWLDLATIEDDPSRFIGLCIEDDADREFFFNSRVPAWKINKMVQAFQQHYGITDRGNRSASRR